MPSQMSLESIHEKVNSRSDTNTETKIGINLLLLYCIFVILTQDLLSDVVSAGRR